MSDFGSFVRKGGEDVTTVVRPMTDYKAPRGTLASCLCYLHGVLSLIARATDVNTNTSPKTTVILSKLRSATVEPDAVAFKVPPSISDNPPPFPLCTKIKMIIDSDEMTCRTTKTTVNNFPSS